MNASTRPRVALVGLGPIGVEVGKALAGRDSMTLLGAADPAPDKAGKPLSDLLAGAFPGTTVRPNAAALYAETAGSRGRADVVLLDSPPSSMYADAVGLTQVTDGVLYVLKSGPQGSVDHVRLLKQLQQGKARLIGIVMNQVEPGAAGYGPYHAGAPPRE